MSKILAIFALLLVATFAFTYKLNNVSLSFNHDIRLRH